MLSIQAVVELDKLDGQGRSRVSIMQGANGELMGRSEEGFQSMVYNSDSTASSYQGGFYKSDIQGPGREAWLLTQGVLIGSRENSQSEEAGTRVHRVLGMLERSAILGLVVPGSHESNEHIVLDSKLALGQGGFHTPTMLLSSSVHSYLGVVHMVNREVLAEGQCQGGFQIMLHNSDIMVRLSMEVKLCHMVAGRYSTSNSTLVGSSELVHISLVE